MSGDQLDLCRTIFMAGFNELAKALHRDGPLETCVTLAAGMRAGLELAADCCVAVVLLDRRRRGAPAFASMEQMDAEEVQPLRRRLMDAAADALLAEKDRMQVEWLGRS